MAGKAIILASGKRGVGAGGKAMVTDADGLCPECCGGCRGGACANCSDIPPSAFTVAFDGITPCPACYVAGLDSGYSHNNLALDIPLSICLAQNGCCYEVVPFPGVLTGIGTLTADTYAGGVCGTFLESVSVDVWIAVTFEAANILRVVLWTYQFAEPWTQLVIFNGTLEITDCYATHVVSNALSGCGDQNDVPLFCASVTDSSQIVATGGTVTLTPCCA